MINLRSWLFLGKYSCFHFVGRVAATASFVWPPRRRRGVGSMASPAARSVDVRGAFLADGGPYEARFSPDACDASFEACKSSGEAFRAWDFFEGKLQGTLQMPAKQSTSTLSPRGRIRIG